MKILNIIFLSCLMCSFAVTGQEPEIDSAYSSELLDKRLSSSSQFTVAVLPMENVSLESDVAYHFRQRTIDLLVAKGYTVMASDWIDNALYQLGLTHAGQLRLLSMQQLSEVVKADGYLFGIVEEARTQNAGVYNAYVYKSSLKMDDARGENLWYSLEQRVSKRRFAADPINALLDIALVNQGADSKQAVGALADRLMSSMPDGPSQVIIGEDLLSMATEVVAVEQQTPANTIAQSSAMTTADVSGKKTENLEHENQALVIENLQLHIKQLELKLKNLELRLNQLEEQPIEN